MVAPALRLATAVVHLTSVPAVASAPAVAADARPAVAVALAALLVVAARPAVAWARLAVLLVVSARPAAPSVAASSSLSVVGVARPPPGVLARRRVARRPLSEELAG